MHEVSFHQALRLVLDAVMPVGTERVALADALGRALAEDVVAESELPPFANSAMDGFALRSADVVDATERRPIRLRLVGMIPAGVDPQVTVGRSQATGIATGALLPPGADSVVRIEEASVEGDEVLVSHPYPPGRDVRLAGEDVRAGSRVLGRGRTVRAPEVAMLAALGRNSVVVGRRPRVAVLTTGDELTGPDDPMRPGKIRDVNLPTLTAQLVEAGAVPVLLGRCRDDPVEVESHLLKACEADLVIVSAGISMGERDYVREVLFRLGTMAFWRIRMRPAGPCAFGRIGSTPLYALPGNPAASVVAFELLVRPACRKLAGHDELQRPEFTARLRNPMLNRGGALNFVRGVVREKNGGLIVEEAGKQGAAILSSLVAANCLIVLDQGVEQVPAATAVPVRLLEGDAWRGQSGLG